MIVHAHFQQKNGGDPTEQWVKARTGCVTASEFGDFVDLSGKLRTGEMPKTFMAEKIFERWTGRKKPTNFFTVDVNNGVLVEEKAAAFAALEYGLEIQHVGFVSNDAGTVGASPDGLIGWEGLKSDRPTEFPVCFNERRSLWADTDDSKGVVEPDDAVNRFRFGNRQSGYGNGLRGDRHC